MPPKEYFEFADLSAYTKSSLDGTAMKKKCLVPENYCKISERESLKKPSFWVLCTSDCNIMRCINNTERKLNLN